MYMFSLVKNIFDFNQKEINRINKIVATVNDLEEKTKKLKDSDFPKETAKMKNQIAEGKNLDELLPWSFALAREAANRTLSQRHFDVQILAAVALHEGKVVEQKTGEGKTLTATAALYLNSLMGKGVHLVTVNDYLARRDGGWMGEIFNFLGVSTSAMISGQSFLYDLEYVDKDAHDPRLVHLRPISRKQAYEADVTYGINSEYGFDYLRDNMTQSPTHITQREFLYAIVDEADSVLIDEARTPHIISAPFDQDTSKYFDYVKIVKALEDNKDYAIDEKLKTANLTEKGIEKIEKMLGVDNIYEKDFDTLFHIEAALKAYTLFQVDRDYIVKDDEVVIVDEFTGRLLEGRRFSEGLHQAIEAKEGVSIKRESKTLATVSLQNYFRMYKKLAGMTGTAATEAQEFSKIYKTDVLVIPTHRPNARKDHPDMIYKKMKGKYDAVVEDIAQQYKKGRPVLVGTTSIERNEYLSRLLNQKGVKHELLNAKNHEREANIIEQAGKKHAVTIATNMAGRGVDIVLGGEIQKDLYKNKADLDRAMKKWQSDHDEVVKLGGLYVIGTERHESRRIDNQLRGRAGRQGDPGETRFYVSLEDDVMRIFGGEQISNLMTMLKFPEDQPLSHGMVSRAIEQAQVKVEGFNFDIRKSLVEYDDVLNRQRDIIYSLRRKILTLPEKDVKKFKETIYEVISDQIRSMSASFFALPDKEEKIKEEFFRDIGFLLNITSAKMSEKLDEGEEMFEKYLLEEAKKEYLDKEKEVGETVWSQVVRSVFLSTIDQFWTEHLTAIDDLRQGINLRGYAQLDPLVEYKNEAFMMFEKLLSGINFESIRRVMRLELQKQENIAQLEQSQEKSDHQHFHFHAASAVDPFSATEQLSDSATPSSAELRQGKQQSSNLGAQPISNPATQKPSSSASQSDAKKKKPGRNEPCWCGSGKKYKKCHLYREPHS